MGRQDIWKPARGFKQMEGPSRPTLRHKEHRTSDGSTMGWDMVLQLADISWWRYEQEQTELEEGEEQAQERRSSIFHAQAEEIRLLGDEATQVFQYAGLRDWRDVALKELRSAGWTPSCVFESSQYPQMMGTKGIDWSRIGGEIPNKQTESRTDAQVRVYVVENVTDGLATSTKHGREQFIYWGDPA